MDLSIVILNYNTRDLLRQCLRSLRKALAPQVGKERPASAGGFTHEVFVVDNASSDGSAEMVSEFFPWVRLIPSPCNLGFSAGNNLAVPHGRSPGSGCGDLLHRAVNRRDGFKLPPRFPDSVGGVLPLF